MLQELVLIRSSSGQWLVGFQVHLGICSNMVAEFQGLRFGRLLSWPAGYRNIICELNAKVVLDLIKFVDVALYLLGSLIGDMRE